MTHDEAMKLALDIKEQFPRLKDPLCIFELCDYVLSLGDMKREIENAAYERAAKLAEDFGKHELDRGDVVMASAVMFSAAQAQATSRDVATNIRSLIQPPAQKENGE